MVRLNLGCGNDIRQNYINIDLMPTQQDIQRGDMKNLDACGIQDGSAEEILCINALQYIRITDLVKVLEQWVKKLTPGGSLYIETLNYNLLGTNMAFDYASIEDINKLLYGEPGQIPPIGVYNLFNVENLLKQMGLKTVSKNLQDNNFMLRMIKAS